MASWKIDVNVIHQCMQSKWLMLTDIPDFIMAWIGYHDVLILVHNLDFTFTQNWAVNVGGGNSDIWMHMQIL